MHQHRNHCESLVDLNVLFRGDEFFQPERTRSVGGKVLLLANPLPEMIREDEFRRNQLVERVDIRQKHGLPETFFESDDLRLKIAGHGISSLGRLTVQLDRDYNLAHAVSVFCRRQYTANKRHFCNFSLDIQNRARSVCNLARDPGALDYFSTAGRNTSKHHWPKLTENSYEVLFVPKRS